MPQRRRKGGTHNKRLALQQARVRDKRRCARRRKACKALAHLHVWQVEGDIGWLSYPTAVALRLEEEHKRTTAQGTVDFTLSSHKYSVDLASMRQTRLSTGTRRQVRRVQLDSLEPSSQGEWLLQRSYIDVGKALCATQQELDYERSAKTSLEAEVGELKSRLGALEQEKAYVEGELSWHQHEAWKEAELLRWCTEDWRRSQHSGNDDSWITEEQSLCPTLQRLLVTTSHGFQEGSRCNEMQAAQVKYVGRICNTVLWDRYMRSANALDDFHDKHGVSAASVQLAVHDFDHQFPWMSLDSGLNEKLLWHGCSAATAHLIQEQGFDPRFSDAECRYGEGTYFTSQACKALQYTQRDSNGWRCMLLCRVLLGDVEYVTTPRQGEKLPSLRDSTNWHKGTFDSFVVNPGDKGGPQGQAHQEFVIFKGEQAYPEFVVWFTT